MTIDFEAPADAFRRAIMGPPPQPKPVVQLPEKPTIRSELVKTKYGLAGPYFYAYWREGKKVKKKYIGKVLPEELVHLFRDKSSDLDISSAMSSMFE